jgi:DUF1680 family protein
MERILYNGALSGVSLKGDTFFYTNPVSSEGGVERVPYFEVACCPANLARLLAHLPGFVYARRGDELFVNLFVASAAEVELDSGRIRVEQETTYPWEGRILLTLSPEASFPMTVHLRIPGWSLGQVLPSDLYRFADTKEGSPSLKVNGEEVPLSVEGGFASIRRVFGGGDRLELTLPMPVRRVAAHDEVEGNRGSLALQRGPLVYAAEAVDNGGRVLDLVLPEEAELEATFQEDLLGGVVAITGTARRDNREVPFLAVPYFTWANRGPGEMAVWIPSGPPATSR